jgi:F-type H+-transporting ATPase subunit delta
VTNRAAAHRYAKALFDVALREHVDLNQVDRDLADLAAVFEQHQTLREVMTNPAVPAPRKRAAMEAIVASARPVPVVAKILVMLADRDRLVILPDLLAAYRERLMEHQQVVRAEVITASPLPADRTANLERRLAGITGRHVALTTRVDPQIIGGIVARIGSTVYDASVATQLNKLKGRLTATP